MNAAEAWDSALEVADWNKIGLGIDKDDVRLARTDANWLAAGSRLRDHVAEHLGEAGEVEQIGSSSVRDLLAKPIVDLAVVVETSADADRLKEQLEASGWFDQGDAGDDGGRIFVLEVEPLRRVAHLHLVVAGDRQWVNWRAFRDLLQSGEAARTEYEAVKIRLARQFPHDRKAYTDGKTDVVRSLLATLS